MAADAPKLAKRVRGWSEQRDGGNAAGSPPNSNKKRHFHHRSGV
jgi:hypothetical protein